VADELIIVDSNWDEVLFGFDYYSNKKINTIVRNSGYIHGMKTVKKFGLLTPIVR